MFHPVRHNVVAAHGNRRQGSPPFAVDPDEQRSVANLDDSPAISFTCRPGRDPNLRANGDSCWTHLLSPQRHRDRHAVPAQRVDAHAERGDVKMPAASQRESAPAAPHLWSSAGVEGTRRLSTGLAHLVRPMHCAALSI